MARSITDWPTPGNAADIRSFLGLAGFYRHFLRHFAQASASLINLLSKDTPCPGATPNQPAACSTARFLAERQPATASLQPTACAQHYWQSSMTVSCQPPGPGPDIHLPTTRPDSGSKQATHLQPVQPTAPRQRQHRRRHQQPVTERTSADASASDSAFAADHGLPDQLASSPTRCELVSCQRKHQHAAVSVLARLMPS